MTTDQRVNSREFIPQSEWPEVSVMLDGFGEPSIPATRQLTGTTLEVEYDDGSTRRYAFHSPSALTWRISGGADAGEQETARYRAVEARPGILFIDFLHGSGTDSHDVSIVLNLVDGRVTTADSRITGDQRTTTTVLHGTLAGHGRIEPRIRSAGLVGKRIYYRYSPTERYEHIYLNSGTFLWHCIEGGEGGLADVDESRTYELDDDLFIFFWTEGVMPVESFLVIDLTQQRSIGRMFCWQESTQHVVHVPFDSRFTILNDTSYPND